MTKLLFVRHGETLQNKLRIFQGQSGAGLTEKGREQAGLLAARLRATRVAFSALYTSDLERAAETASILGDALGLIPKAHPGLREVALGRWEGLHEDEIRAAMPEEWAAWRNGEDIARGGGECLADVTARMARAAEEIATEHEGRTVVLVSHGAAIKSFAAHVLSTKTTRLRALRPVSNTGACLFERGRDGGYSLVVYNDTTHLGDALQAALES
ncbi:MAG: histidine phosphatase family protein [Polyangiaceae bacterium]|nr:histidine phosphatase family protein [Polyangiaceae bacterium]